MRTLVFSARPYDRHALEQANSGQHELVFTETLLNEQSAVMAQGFPAVSLFVNDRANEAVLTQLVEGGTQLIAQRSTGYNNIDLPTAKRLGITAMRVGYYSPYSVAEHAVALLQTLNRKTHRAYNRVRESNFLLDGLVGQDIHGKTVGVIGTGKIGTAFAQIMHGFGCTLLGYDLVPNPVCVGLGMSYTTPEEIARQADIISLHVPLTPETHHLIDTAFLSKTKPGVILINTSRGKLVDTAALMDFLRTGHLRAVGLDVYEEEESLFFRDFSQQIVADEMFLRLLSFPNVLVTAHQAFLTEEALTTIAETTLQNLTDFAEGRTNANTLTL
jgi:D-lactate dehydrogenase